MGHGRQTPLAIRTEVIVGLLGNLMLVSPHTGNLLVGARVNQTRVTVIFAVRMIETSLLLDYKLT